MATGLSARLFFAVVVALGSFAGKSFAADKAKELDLPQALAQARLFAGLTDEEREALKATTTLRRAKSQERIIEQGTTLDRMYIILDGQAEVRANGKLVATLSGQSLVGEIEFLDSLPASADVVILKESHLLELNNAGLTALMKKHPRLGYALMGEIARIEGQRLRAMNQK